MISATAGSEVYMVKHIILWTLKDELTEAEKANVKKEAKEALEGLVGVIPGLVEMHINTGKLAKSTADMMMDSTFESEEALAAYSKNPAHVAVADSKVRPFTQSRACLNFEA